MLMRLGEGERKRLRIQRPVDTYGALLLELSGSLLPDRGRIAHLLDGEAGEDRARMLLDQVVLVARILIALLDEEPVLLLAAAVLQMRADERICAPHLEAVHLDVEFAFAHALGRVAIRRIDDLVHAAIPQDDLAGAVVVFGNYAFEVAVVDWMVLDMNREALFFGIERWPFRHRPRTQHALHREAEVIVEACRGMLLDAKHPARASEHSAGGISERLRRPLRVALMPILLERHRSTSDYAKAMPFVISRTRAAQKERCSRRGGSSHREHSGGETGRRIYLSASARRRCRRCAGAVDWSRPSCASPLQSSQ